MKGKIFNAQEVQAMLNGSKVMFREVIKPYPILSDDKIKDIFKESKSAGFDNKIVRKLIRAAKNPAKLPDWKDLLGIAPNATGGLSSEEFIKNLRNEWQ